MEVLFGSRMAGRKVRALVVSSSFVGSVGVGDGEGEDSSSGEDVSVGLAEAPDSSLSPAASGRSVAPGFFSSFSNPLSGDENSVSSASSASSVESASDTGTDDGRSPSLYPLDGVAVGFPDCSGSIGHGSTEL